MDLFITSFMVVFPLALKLLLGFSIRKAKILSLTSFKEFNKLIFTLFLPVLLFNNIYHSNIKVDFNGELILFALFSLLALFTLFMIVIPRIEKENPKRGVLVQGMSRSNFILFGIPVAQALYGEGSLGQATILVSFVVPAINVLSVVALESFRNKNVNIKKIAKGIATNPLIIASIAAYVCVITGLVLPRVIESFISEIASIATPIALIILGGSVSFHSIKDNKKQLTIAIAGKLILAPLLGIVVAILLGFRNESLVILMAMFASPTAVSSFSMAVSMDGDAELAGLIIVFTTFLSIISLFFITFSLLALGYI
ncbi:MAG: AEC family transporter [Spirochaetia bacterium]|nr:AEC family transporter [Spirochaetia bacterium]